MESLPKKPPCILKKFLCTCIVLLLATSTMYLSGCNDNVDMKYNENGEDRPEISWDDRTYVAWGMLLVDNNGVGDEFSEILIGDKESCAIYEIEGISSDVAFVVNNEIYDAYQVYMNYDASPNDKDYIKEHLNFEPAPLE